LLAVPSSVMGDIFFDIYENVVILVNKNFTFFKEEKSEHILLILEQIESEISLSKLLAFTGHDETI